MSPQKNPRTVCFLLLPRVHLMDLSGPAQVFYEASQLGSTRYHLVYCSVRPEVESEQGLPLGALPSFKDISLNPNDFLFIPGIDFRAFKEGRLKESIRAIKPWLHTQWSRGVRLASICSGSLILAEAGLLENRKCTSHWKCIDYMKASYPRADIQTDQLYVYDQNIYTSAGMTSGIDMALSILEQQHGPVLPARVAREMVVYLRRNPTDRQQTIYLDYQTHFNPAIHRVQDYIISHPSENSSLAELAEVGHVSVRNLTRLFKKSTGHTIVDFKNTVRLELARTLLHNRDYTLEKIAELCGFQSVRQLRRVWKGKEKGTLREHRTANR